MKKGQTKRVWTPEQKAEIVHKHLDEQISVRAGINGEKGMWNNDLLKACV